MYRENYSHNPAFAEILVRDFEEKMRAAGTETKMYVFHKDNKLIAFCGFDEVGENGGEYMWGVNADKRLRGVGDVFLRTAIHKEAEEHDLSGLCSPGSPVASYYIDKSGFVAKRVFENYGGSGEDGFEIVRVQDRSSRGYAADTMSRDDIIADAVDGKSLKADEKFFADRDRGNKPIILKFRKQDERSVERPFVRFAQELMNQRGMVMTRYFFSGPKKNEIYAVFEQERGESEAKGETLIPLKGHIFSERGGSSE